MVRSMTSQPTSISRLRACEGEIAWSTRTTSARRVSGSAADCIASFARAAPLFAARRRWRRCGGRVFGLAFDEAAQFLALAHPQIASGIESHPLLHERAHDLEAQRLPQSAELVQRELESVSLTPGNCTPATTARGGLASVSLRMPRGFL